MYWADELAETAVGPQVVSDSKTPSGTIHVGSLRGPILVDAIWRALRDRGVEARATYGIDDMDPMDAQALLTPDAVERYMGAPLARVPAPEGSPAPSYARHFAGLFLDTFASLGVRHELFWMSELYAAGAVDPYIRLALDRADRVRGIYARVANVRHPADWHPVSVVCESCGKVGTTIVVEWDGSRVRYECRPDLVQWAHGCGNGGWVSPFGGRSKLPWNLEWAAQWGLLGVTIEPSGKDLSTKGGSRDRSDAIARDVFDREPPLNVPYEFLNIGGKKMSTSRGRGATAHEMAELLPPQLLRFLFLRHRPNHALEFDPSGDTLPRLFDEFDRVAAATAGGEVKGELPPDPERIFRQCLVDATADERTEASRYRPAFAHVSLLSQIPGVDVAARIESEKGAPLGDAEGAILAERLAAARAWLDGYAPDRARITVRRDGLPREVAALSDEQRMYLGALALAAADSRPASGEAWQDLVFRVAERAAMPAGRAFGAIYFAFLARPNGPRAGWLLAALPREFAVERLRQAAGWNAPWEEDQSSAEGRSAAAVDESPGTEPESRS
jgi:lysyl-tRNA synthetase, class I